MKSVTLEQLRGELDALVAEAADGQIIEIVVEGPSGGEDGLGACRGRGRRDSRERG